MFNGILECALGTSSEEEEEEKEKQKTEVIYTSSIASSKKFSVRSENKNDKNEKLGEKQKCTTEKKSPSSFNSFSSSFSSVSSASSVAVNSVGLPVLLYSKGFFKNTTTEDIKKKAKKNDFGDISEVKNEEEKEEEEEVAPLKQSAEQLKNKLKRSKMKSTLPLTSFLPKPKFTSMGMNTSRIDLQNVSISHKENEPKERTINDQNYGSGETYRKDKYLISSFSSSSSSSACELSVGKFEESKCNQEEKVKSSFDHIESDTSTNIKNENQEEKKVSLLDSYYDSEEEEEKCKLEGNDEEEDEKVENKEDQRNSSFFTLANDKNTLFDVSSYDLTETNSSILSCSSQEKNLGLMSRPLYGPTISLEATDISIENKETKCIMNNNMSNSTPHYVTYPPNTINIYTQQGGVYVQQQNTLAQNNQLHVQRDMHALQAGVMSNSMDVPPGKEWKDLDMHRGQIKDISAQQLIDPQWQNNVGIEPFGCKRKKFDLATKVYNAQENKTVMTVQPKFMQKRKHQINWLAKEAQEKELQLMEITAHTRQSKYHTQMKYGW